jgi:hypothetical protein
MLRQCTMGPFAIHHPPCVHNVAGEGGGAVVADWWWHTRHILAPFVWLHTKPFVWQSRRGCMSTGIVRPGLSSDSGSLLSWMHPVAYFYN